MDSSRREADSSKASSVPVSPPDPPAEDESGIRLREFAAMGAAVTGMNAAVCELRVSVLELLKERKVLGLRNLREQLEAAGFLKGPDSLLGDVCDTLEVFFERTQPTSEQLGKFAFRNPTRHAPNLGQSVRGGQTPKQCTFRFGEAGSSPASFEASWTNAASVASLPAWEIDETSNVQVSRDSEGNKLINQYEVIGKLGQGSYGKVKLAIHSQTGKTVAIKVMNKSLLRKARAGGATQWERVQTEIAIMKKMRHKNIVSLYEVIDDPHCNKLYLVMQYVPHGPVLKLGSDGRCTALDEETAREYFRQLTSGLHYLHRHNIVHRDLKPDNILLGDDKVVYLTDFGVSEMFEDSHEDNILGQAGTPLFFSPELCRGEGAVHGKAVDVWALGVTLYCMLTGALPFFSDDVLEAMHMIQNNSLCIPDCVSMSAASLLRGMLDKDPRRRMTLVDIRNHSWVTHLQTGAGATRARRMSEFDVLTVEQDDVDHAIALANTGHYRLPTMTAKDRISNFVRGIRDRVKIQKPDVQSPNERPPVAVEPHAPLCDNPRPKRSTTVTLLTPFPPSEPHRGTVEHTMSATAGSTSPSLKLTNYRAFE